ncbi:MAG TPA: hypothetical protein VIH57_18155 [Bacteroidales bacterium]
MRSIRILIILLFIISCTRTNKKIEHYVIEIRDPKLYTLSDTLEYSDFNVIVDYDNKHSFFNSIDSIFSRRYLDGIRDTNVYLDLSEKKKAYNVIKKYDFYSLPNVIEEGGDEYTCVSPSSSIEITIVIGKNQKSVFYSGSCSIKDKQIDYRFNNITKVISEIIFNKKEIVKMKRSDIIAL